MSDLLFRGVGVEVDIKTPQNFLKIKETLTRIGVAAKDEKRLYQSCHILHKRDSNGISKYAILHFKELFKLDGKPSNLEESDLPRRNAIARLLEEWGLVVLVYPETAQEVVPIQSIKILPFKEKSEWELCAKYSIGKKRKE